MSTVPPFLLSLALLHLTLYDAIDCQQLLLRKGHYRTERKGPKTQLTNVTHIDGEVIPDERYIKISAKIPTLHAAGVRNLGNVTTLSLIFCAIRELRPGAFVNLSSLSTLSLHDNDIEHLPRGVFNGMSVSVLFLQRNEIGSIDGEAFDSMPNLSRLKLNSNRITSLDGRWFEGSPRVTELFLRRNKITEVPARAFRNVKGSHLSPFGDAMIVDTKIYLSKNQITAVHPDAFQGLEDFSQLWLDRNYLTELDARTFSNITQIGAVFLSKNRLETLPKTLFADVQAELLKLDLVGNKNFTCVPYEVAVKVRKTNLRGIKMLDVACVREVLERFAQEHRHNEIKFNK